MNTFKFLVLTLSLLTSQVNATTAVLCGKPELVDADNKNASVHLIFDNADSRAADEVQAYSRGKQLMIQSVSGDHQKISINLKDNKVQLQFGAKYIDPSNCEDYSEKTFSMEFVAGLKKTIVRSCRCFQD